MNQPTTPPKSLGAIWGDAVAERRKLLGLSQQTLADLCGTTQQTISKIELGEIIPRDRLKVTIANRLGVPLSALFAWPELAAR